MNEDMKVGGASDVPSGGRRRDREHKRADPICEKCTMRPCACIAACPTCDLGDYYEDVVVRNDVSYADTKRALEIVDAFIIERDLILVGGMGIDMALKVIGRPGIYLNEKLPDYDFLSPDTVSDASDLSARLCRAGLPNVSAINAKHSTTIRVRANFVSAADITYCPKAMFDKLPTLKIGRMRVIHPHFQVADIHHSMSYPFELMFTPVALYRWKKDCVRYDLLTEAYPIDAAVNSPCTECTGGSTSAIPPDIFAGTCIGGWAALSYWKKLVASGGSAKELSGFDIPAGEPIQVYVNDLDEFLGRAKAEHVAFFEARLGHIPASATCTIAGRKYEIFDNFGMLISAEAVSGDMYVANMQACMLFLLAKIYLYPDTSPELAAACRRLYSECVTIVTHAELPGLLPSANVFGIRALDDAYLIHRRRFAARIRGQRLETAYTITSVYPAPPKCTADIVFDYEASPFFHIAGKQTTSHERRVLVES
jgi:hypothetical protein